MNDNSLHPEIPDDDKVVDLGAYRNRPRDPGDENPPAAPAAGQRRPIDVHCRPRIEKAA